MVRWWLAPSVVAVTLSATSARAQTDDERARAHFESASVFYADERYEEAATAFLESYRLSRRPELLDNAARSYERALQFDRAIEVIAELRESHPDYGSETALRARVRNLERLRDRVDGEPEAADDTREEPPAREEPPEHATDETELWVPGFAIAGGGAAVLIAGLVLGGVALGESDGIAELCPELRNCDPSLRGRYDEMRLMAGASDVLWIGGAVVMAAGVVLGLAVRENRDETVVTGGCGVGGCGMVVRGRF